MNLLSSDSEKINELSGHSGMFISFSEVSSEEEEPVNRRL